MHPLVRGLAITWGLLGIFTLLGRALVTLTPKAIEALVGGLSWWQWLIAAGWVAFMAYAEGYRGFQGKFSPMVASRLLVIREDPTWFRVLLAPMFCMGLINATRRRLAVSWGILIGVFLLVLLVRLLPQPWRGIVDLGVVVGLGWGSVSLAIHAFKALWTGEKAADPELPTRETEGEGVDGVESHQPG